MKRIILGWLLVLSALFVFVEPISANEGDIAVYVDGVQMQCEKAPFIKDEKTMVPMRKIFESLNASINWDAATQTVTAVRGNSEIILQIGNTILKNNGVDEDMGVAPIIVDEMTFIPVRAVSQSLNATVEWNEQTRSIYIFSPVTMYAADGRTTYVLQSEVSAYQNVGWYTEPVTLMYAADGRTTYVLQSEVGAYQNVGWYTEPVTLMYAADGRTTYVLQSEVGAYQNVGWYTSPPQQKVSAPVSSSKGGNASYSGGSTHSGVSVYITPTGKRYHYSAACAGKNATGVSLDEAQRLGFTPCKKCA